VPAIRATPRHVPDGVEATEEGDTDQVACQCPTCDPVGWLPLVERGEKLRGWVRRGNVWKGMRADNGCPPFTANARAPAPLRAKAIRAT
jgi:hypothetical protein